MAKNFTIDYATGELDMGADTLREKFDLDEVTFRQPNLGQRYNIGGLVRQNYDRGRSVAQIIDEVGTVWPKITKKIDEFFPSKPKEAEIISIKEFNEPKIPGSDDDVIQMTETLFPKLEPIQFGKNKQPIYSGHAKISDASIVEDLSTKVSSTRNPNYRYFSDKKLASWLKDNINYNDERWWNVANELALRGHEMTGVAKILDADPRNLWKIAKRRNLNVWNSQNLDLYDKTFKQLDAPFSNLREINKDPSKFLKRIKKIDKELLDNFYTPKQLSRIFGFKWDVAQKGPFKLPTQLEGARRRHGRYHAQDVLDNFNDTIKYWQKSGGKDYWNIAKEEAYQFIGDDVWAIAKSFRTKKLPTRLERMAKEGIVHPRIPEIFKKYKLNEIETGHRFPAKFFYLEKKVGGQDLNKKKPLFDWIRRNKDKLIDSDNLAFQSKHLNQELLKKKLGGLEKLYKDLGVYVNKYEGKTIPKAEKIKIEAINKKITDYQAKVNQDIDKYLKSKGGKKDRRTQMSMSRGGMDVALFDTTTSQVFKYSGGYPESSITKSMPGNLNISRLNIKESFKDIVNNIIDDPKDLKIFNEFMETYMHPTGKSYTWRGKSYASGGPVVPRVAYKDGSEKEPFKAKDQYELFEDIAQVSSGYADKDALGKLGDIADWKNWLYYTSMLPGAAVNVAEIAAKLPFVGAELISELITKKPSKEIFMKALKDITPGAWKEKVGLTALDEAHEEKMKKWGMSHAPKAFKDMGELSLEVVSPWGYGIAAKVINKFKKVLAPEKRKVFDQTIADALDAKGMSRRQFNTLVVSGGTIAALKALGLDRVFKGVPSVKVADVTKIERIGDGQPTYLNDLIAVVRAKGERSTVPGYKGSDYSTKHTYKDIEVIEDPVGNITIKRDIEGGGQYTDEFGEVETWDGTVKELQMEIKKDPEQPKASSYEEATARPDQDGMMEDVEFLIDDADHLELKEIADEINDLIGDAASFATGGRVSAQPPKRGPLDQGLRSLDPGVIYNEWIR